MDAKSLVLSPHANIQHPNIKSVTDPTGSDLNVSMDYSHQTLFSKKEPAEATKIDTSTTSGCAPILGHLTAAHWKDRVPLIDFQSYVSIYPTSHMMYLRTHEFLYIFFFIYCFISLSFLKNYSTFRTCARLIRITVYLKCY